MEHLVEWELAGESEVLGENLPNSRFFHRWSYMIRIGIEPEPQGGNWRLTARIMEQPNTGDTKVLRWEPSWGSFTRHPSSQSAYIRFIWMLFSEIFLSSNCSLPTFISIRILYEFLFWSILVKFSALRTIQNFSTVPVLPVRFVYVSKLIII
jgi:hypothetical protein